MSEDPKATTCLHILDNNLGSKIMAPSRCYKPICRVGYTVHIPCREALPPVVGDERVEMRMAPAHHADVTLRSCSVEYCTSKVMIPIPAVPR
jgi:hypothetical protein